MTNRKRLSATKKQQNRKDAETEVLMENDAVLFPEEDDPIFDNLELDDDLELELDSDELDTGENELDADDFDIEEGESVEDEFDADDLDLDEDESEDDDPDFDEDESEDDDFDFDEDESEDDDLDSDDEPEDKDLFSDTVKLDNDPFAFNVELRQAALPASTKMLMAVKEVDYKIIPAEESKYGNEYKTFTLVGEIKHPTTKELITIKETGTTKNASFVQKVTAINNGILPKSLSEIVGKQAVVTIIHNTDQLGNVWDNIDTVEPYKPSSKKKAK